MGLWLLVWSTQGQGRRVEGRGHSGQHAVCVAAARHTEGAERDAEHVRSPRWRCLLRAETSLARQACPRCFVCRGCISGALLSTSPAFRGSGVSRMSSHPP